MQGAVYILVYRALNFIYRLEKSIEALQRYKLFACYMLASLMILFFRVCSAWLRRTGRGVL